MDCWPQISDAVVDYYFCKKLAYFFIRRSQQPICLMMDDHTGELVLYGVSELAWECGVRFQVHDVESGEVLAEGSSYLGAEASTPLYTIREKENNVPQRMYSITWETADGQKGNNHYLQGKPPYRYDWYMECLKKLGYDEFEGF